jgi:hypothetical protein
MTIPEVDNLVMSYVARLGIEAVLGLLAFKEWGSLNRIRSQCGQGPVEFPELPILSHDIGTDVPSLVAWLSLHLDQKTFWDQIIDLIKEKHLHTPQDPGL